MSKLPTFRNNRVMAFDSKYTGEEPNWDLQNSWTDEEFNKEYNRLFGFYGYYLSSKDLKPDVIRFMKSSGKYTEEQIDKIMSFPDWVVSGTTGKLCRCLNKGLSSDRVKQITNTDILDIVHTDINKGINFKQIYAVRDEDDTDKKPVVSIQERLEQKVMSTLGNEFDTMLDTWIGGDDKVLPLNISALLTKHSVSPMGLKFLTPRIEKLLTELTDAKEAKYEEVTEGYSYLSKKGLNFRIAACEDMLDQVVKITHAKKAERKPRVKKVKSAEKQVSRLKFMQASAEYSVKSVSPMSIPGAHRVYVFNTKNRVLTCYESASPVGLEVKGSAIKNFTDTASFNIRLRKPNDLLPDVLSKTSKQLDKAIDSIKAKKSVPNGRINDQTVILRIFQK